MIQDIEYDFENNAVCLWTNEDKKAHWENFSPSQLKDLINDLILERDQLKESSDAAIAYCDVELKYSKNFGNDYWAGKNNATLKTCEDIEKILKNNEFIKIEEIEK